MVDTGLCHWYSIYDQDDQDESGNVLGFLFSLRFHDMGVSLCINGYTPYAFWPQVAVTFINGFFYIFDPLIEEEALYRCQVHQSLQDAIKFARGGLPVIQRQGFA